MPPNTPMRTVPNHHRCTRNDGRRWRCLLPRFGGTLFCEKHHLYNLSKRKPKPDKLSKPKAVMTQQGSAAVSESPNADDLRCTKYNSSGWRCGFLRFGMNLLCQTHLIEDGKHKRKSRVSSSSPVRIENAKKIDNTFDEICSVDNEEVGVVRVMRLGEIWALSEEPNGIPRFYGRVDQIVPIEPEILKITPLFFEPVLDEDVMLAEQGINLGCGVFKMSELVLEKEYLCFSHKVRFEVENNNGGALYKIFPKNGEVWAVYLDWDEAEEKFEYKLVEVVSDFTEEDGVCVFGLGQVEGRKGIYKRDLCDGFEHIRRFSRAFMPMFSHQVPVTRIEENGELFWETMLH